jgi:hypothetical protein
MEDKIMKNVFFLKVVLLLLLFSITHSYSMRVLAQQTFGSSATIGENQNTNVNASNGLGTTSVVQEHFLREMRVTIRAEEQSYSRMQEGSAQVLENPSGSIWSAGEMVGGLFKPGAYAKTSSVLFRLWQRPNPTATKIYKPEFRGVVEFFGEGVGEKKDPYAWNVINADYEIKDIEIHRSVAGGTFVKISDEQNVEPVVVGQEIKLKVVIDPNVSSGLTYQWDISGGVPIKKYEFDNTKADVTELEYSDKNKSQIIFYHTNKGNANISVKVTPWGSEETVTKNVNYVVVRPEYSKFEAEWTLAVPKVGIFMNPDGSEVLGLGGYYQHDSGTTNFSPGIRWVAGVTLPTIPANTDGYITYIQLVKANVIDTISNKKFQFTTNNNYVLDTQAPYREQERASGDHYLVDRDTPAVQVKTSSGAYYRSVDVKNDFQVYLMFKPDGTNSIWVTLGIMPWDWQGKAERSWEKMKAIPEACKSGGGISITSSTLPIWQKNIKDYSFVEVK